MRFLLEQYHNDQVWIDEYILLGMDQIELLMGLPTKPKRDIKSVMEATKKIGDEEIRVEFSDGDEIIVSSRGIIINRITNIVIRWAKRLFSTWFYNSSKTTDILKGWFIMINFVADHGMQFPWAEYVKEYSYNAIKNIM